MRLLQPMDCSLLGSSVHGILQARTLQWVTISFSRGSSWSRDGIQISCRSVALQLISWTVSRFFTNWVTREASNKYKDILFWWLGRCKFIYRFRYNLRAIFVRKQMFILKSMRKIRKATFHWTNYKHLTYYSHFYINFQISLTIIK